MRTIMTLTPMHGWALERSIKIGTIEFLIDMLTPSYWQHDCWWGRSFHKLIFRLPALQHCTVHGSSNTEIKTRKNMNGSWNTRSPLASMPLPVVAGRGSGIPSFLCIVAVQSDCTSIWWCHRRLSVSRPAACTSLPSINKLWTHRSQHKRHT
jgi:hypothetical protein